MKIVAVEPIGISSTRAETIKKDLSKKGYEFVWYDNRSENPDELVRRMKDAEMVIVSNIPLPKSVLSKCEKLKYLNVAFTGLDHIDLEYCESQGIKVQNASGYATEAVAELAVALTLDVYRKISSFNNFIRNGGARGAVLGFELRGKTVGIVGTGAIGLRTAELFKAFGCNIIACSRTEKAEALANGLKYVPLDELMQQSDIISLHLPLTGQTENLIDRERLSLCKSSAVIINTARGKVLDNLALAEFLNDEKIAGAGIDVYETEPPLPENHPLLTAKNCVLVPHVGYATREAFDDRIDIVLNHIATLVG